MATANFENGMYIVGTDYRIRYANETLKNFFPKVVEGTICYKAIADRDTPCTFCPIANNLEKGKLLFNSPNFSRYGAAFTNIDTPEFKNCYSVMIQEIASPNVVSKLDNDEMQAFLLQQKELKTETKSYRHFLKSILQFISFMKKMAFSNAQKIMMNPHLTLFLLLI